MLKWILIFCLLGFFGAASAFTNVTSTDSMPSVPVEKQTPQGKYLTVHQAFHTLTNDPSVLFVDVRDPVEVSLFGQPALVDAVVPIQARSTVFDDDLKQWLLKDNPEFLSSMSAALKHFGKAKTDMIILTCGSGRRSSQAARILFENGYTNVWHIPDGYKGDEQPGVNTSNAWKLAELPWSHKDVYGSQWLIVIQ